MKNEKNGESAGPSTTPVVYRGEAFNRYAEVRDMGDGSYEVSVENGGVTTIYDHDEAHALAQWWVK